MSEITLPAYSFSSINRCNLSANILGSLTFQAFPNKLYIDGVMQHHRQLFDSLQEINDAQTRCLHFTQYMKSAFLLDDIEQAGLVTEQHKKHRGKASYLSLLRGWMFNSNSIEGAVLKFWMESRFGLRPLYHGGNLNDTNSDTYTAYTLAYARGLYNTNALEAQLDLLFSYAQFELGIKYLADEKITLFRGINNLQELNIIESNLNQPAILLLNNVNSFTDDKALADSFGDYIIETQVPVSKIVCFSTLLPDLVRSEREFIVMGGLYQTSICAY